MTQPTNKQRYGLYELQIIETFKDNNLNPLSFAELQEKMHIEMRRLMMEVQNLRELGFLTIENHNNGKAGDVLIHPLELCNLQEISQKLASPLKD